MHHIGITPEQCPADVIVCGEPKRVDMLAELLTDKSLVAHNREYYSVSGKFNGHTVMITSHGIGSAGAAICFQELSMVGAQRIIRIGTAGGLYDSQVGDLVCSTAAVRDDGASERMIPIAYPAVASYDLVNKLQSQALAAKQTMKVGITLTSDLFYPETLPTNLELYQKAGVLAVEMELSTLLVIAGLRGFQAAGILVLDGQPLKWDEGNYDPKSPKKTAGLMSACKISLEALAQKS